MVESHHPFCFFGSQIKRKKGAAAVYMVCEKLKFHRDKTVCILLWLTMLN